MTTILGVPQVSQALLEDLDRVGRKYDRWTAEAYFELDGPYLVEYSRGNLEIVPMPTMTHQRLASRLHIALHEVAPAGSEVLFAGARIRVDEDVYREPDVLYIPREWTHLMREQYAERAGLVIEIVSASNRDHDLDIKRREYAAAGIPEYWIVEPEERRVTVLTLKARRYTVRGAYSAGQQATSAILPKFNVDVAALFDGV
ncbi:MAG TPA: Uma2 family endonuclease [Tepidisphaeraceae bacterium]|jgi:Uma2 family endonuclease|nr:Uma2 family endonuclease [Tepidisphaeraceae bacterium]